MTAMIDMPDMEPEPDPEVPTFEPDLDFDE